MCHRKRSPPRRRARSRPPRRAPILPVVTETTVERSNGARSVAPDAFNIVIIEDNDDVADTMADLLAGIGHRVAVARSGADGIALIRSARPDIVLCDLGLPGMDGIEVCRSIRAMTLPEQPIMVALTGWGREADRRRTSDAGFDHHLVKPVASDKLHALLRSIRS